MGVRANVYVKDGDEHGVYLYTHWSGHELPGIVQEALRRGSDRHNDGQYLARIVFQEMLDGDTGTTGYGISAVMGDNSYPIIVLDPNASPPTVAFAKEGEERAGPYVHVKPMVEYAEQDDVVEWPEMARR